MKIDEAPKLFYTIEFSSFELEALYKVTSVDMVEMTRRGLSLGEIQVVQEFQKMLDIYVENKPIRSIPKCTTCNGEGWVRVGIPNQLPYHKHCPDCDTRWVCEHDFGVDGKGITQCVLCGKVGEQQ